MAKRMPPYVDLYKLPEDERIDVIGEMAVTQKKIVGVVVEKENGDKSKGDRYIEKLKCRFPGIVLLIRTDGPVPNTELLKFGPPQFSAN